MLLMLATPARCCQCQQQARRVTLLDAIARISFGSDLLAPGARPEVLGQQLRALPPDPAQPRRRDVHTFLRELIGPDVFESRPDTPSPTVHNTPA